MARPVHRDAFCLTGVVSAYPGILEMVNVFPQVAHFAICFGTTLAVRFVLQCGQLKVTSGIKGPEKWTKEHVVNESVSEKSNV